MIIMHTTCHREFGGLEKRIYNESCQMAKRGHQIIIAAPAGTPLMIRSLSRGFQCLSIEFTATTALKDYFALRRIYSELKPHVLNTHGNTDSKVALAAACNMQTITGKNSTTRVSNNLMTERLARDERAMRSTIPCTILSRHISADVKPSWYNRLLYNRLCRYVFTTADYTTEHLVSTLHLDPNRVFTIPSGILPPSELPDHDRARSDLAAELTTGMSLRDKNKIHAQSRFIGFVGRVSEDKGVRDIINAFVLIAERLPEYHLVIVGHGEMNSVEEMKKMVKQTRYGEFIHFTGFKENTWPYYRAFDCKILASQKVEGISQSLLEAMYAKCPVAGSQIGGTCDIIRDGETGLLFRPGQSEEIAKCILQILNDRVSTKRRVDSAFQMVKERYTIGSMIDQILNCYCKATLY